MAYQAIRMLDACDDRTYEAEAERDFCDASRPLTFGHYMVLPASRALLRRGRRVELGSRAFDLLVVLLRARGRIVTKDEIVRYVWPSTIVVESNLRYQMASLRKALGNERDRIKAVPGRGYLFIADNDEAETETVAAIAPPRAVAPATGRPSIIIIIDEDPENREALHRLLRPFDAYVQSFGSVDDLLASGSGAGRRAQAGPAA